MQQDTYPGISSSGYGSSSDAENYRRFFHVAVDDLVAGSCVKFPP
jgi:hypothetical protein